MKKPQTRDNLLLVTLHSCMKLPYLCDSFASQLVEIYANVFDRPLATTWRSFMVDQHFLASPDQPFLRERWSRQLPFSM